MLLLCYLSHAPVISVANRPVDVLQVCDWQYLADNCWTSYPKTFPALLEEFSGETESTATNELLHYLQEGQGSLRVGGFIDGKERQLDLIRFVWLPTSKARNILTHFTVYTPQVCAFFGAVPLGV